MSNTNKACNGKAILTLNAGSSSLKFGLFSRTNKKQFPIKKVLSGQISGMLSGAPQCVVEDSNKNILARYVMEVARDSDPYSVAAQHVINIIAEHAKYESVGITSHRIVHGADEFKETVRIDSAVLNNLERYISLAALHQPFNLMIAKLFYETKPEWEHFACFDTAFHQTMDPIGRVYAIPARFMADGIKRYGFHGISYQYVVNVLVNQVGEEMANKKWIICHLGSGASLCAVRNKKSVYSSMGFSVVSGIPMATRCGDIDPKILIYMAEQYKMSIDQLDNMMYKESGLLGVSGGISNEMYVLLKSNTAEAKLAVDVFCYNTSLFIGKLAAANDGCDGLVFTAGIGENSKEVRELICKRCSWLGVELDKERNDKNETEIQSIGSIPVLVIPTNEEYEMALEAFHRRGHA